MEELIRQLEALGCAVEEKQGIAIIKGFHVQAGRDMGQVVDVGILGSDFPFTPPAGIHIRPILPPPAKGGVSASPLGDDWQYWSRRLPDWQKDRSAHHIISYVNKVFLDA